LNTSIRRSVCLSVYATFQSVSLLSDIAFRYSTRCTVDIVSKYMYMHRTSELFIDRRWCARN